MEIDRQVNIGTAICRDRHNGFRGFFNLLSSKRAQRDIYRQIDRMDKEVFFGTS